MFLQDSLLYIPYIETMDFEEGNESSVQRSSITDSITGGDGVLHGKIAKNHLE